MSEQADNRKFLFADESGCLVFKDNGTASRYFILATACFAGANAALELLALRRELLWLRNTGAIRASTRIDNHFHATKDEVAIRHAVYRRLQEIDFRVDATILEKRKALPWITANSAEFYRYAWFYHLKYVAPKIADSKDCELHVLPASLGTRRQKAAFNNSVNNVLQQVLPRAKWSVDFVPSSADPGLQVADYCAYAIFQKWERANSRWYDYISAKMRSEFNLWGRGSNYYY